MRIDGAWKRTEASALRHVLEIICPGDAMFFQKIKNGAGDRLIASASRKRKAIAGGEMAKRSGGQQVRAIGECWPQDRREIAVIHGKLLRQIIVEGNLVLVVEGHRLIVG